MNESFNLKLQEWVNNEKRTVEDGCLLLLQLEGNRIHYDNLMRYPYKDKLMKYLLSELSRRLKTRLVKVTHQQVTEMQDKVKAIESEHFSEEKKKEVEEFRKGKRADHDELPDEIQALYVENLSLLQRMREVHLKLRKLSDEKVSCPDSERYPFLKEMIELDKKLHENWDVYDHYVPEAESTGNLVSFEPESSNNLVSPDAESTSVNVSEAEEEGENDKAKEKVEVEKKVSSKATTKKSSAKKSTTSK